MLFCMVASGSVTNFFPTVVATLGFNTINSLLLTAPPYVCTSNRMMMRDSNADHAQGLVRYYNILERVARRSDGRTILPHHTSPIRVRCRFYPRRCNDSHCAEVFGDDAHGARCLHWLRRRSWLDLEHPATSACETCCGSGGHQCGLEYFFHLLIVHVQSKR